MKRYVLSIGAILLMLATVALAQGRAGMQGGGQGRAGAMAGQGGGVGPPATAGGSTNSSPQRQRMRATDQQRQQLRECDQTMQQVHGQLREMARTSAGYGLSSQQAEHWREQLRNQMHVMTQQQETLRANLSPEQTTAVADRLRKLQQDTERLQMMSDALGLELDAEQPDANQIREQSQQMEKVANQVRTQQQKLSSDLGVDLP